MSYEKGFVATLAELEDFYRGKHAGDVIELMNQTNDILSDVKWMESNQSDGHLTRIRTGLPEVYWRRLYRGTPPSKSQYSQVKEICGMLEASMELDVAEIELYGDRAKAFRLSEAMAFAEAMRQKVASTIFYGDSNVRPDEFNGLAMRYPSKSSPHVLDAGGTGSKCISTRASSNADGFGMTVSRTQICNMALGFVGTRTITAINEHAPEAIQCELYWDRARRSALRDFPYPFSQRRIRLASVILPSEISAVWRKCYAVPVEALKINSVGDGSPFEIGQAQGMLRIFCNVDDAIAVCTVDVPEISLWDELFIMAMAYRLAMLVAVPLLKGNSQKLQELASLYNAAVPKAMDHAANEGKQNKPENENSWLTAREIWP